MKNKVLSPVDIFAIIAGNMLGVGVFLTPYYIAGVTKTPIQYIFIWIITAVIALVGGFMYVGLVWLFPLNGGDYYYIKHFWNKKLSLLFFITMYLFVFPGSIAILAYGAGTYVTKILLLFSINGTYTPEIAVSIVLFFIFLNLNKKRIAVINEKIYVFLIIILILMIFYFIYSHSSSLHKIIFQNQWNTSWKSWIQGILYTYFSFVGFASIAYLGNEIKQPLRKLVISSAGAISLISVIYLIINIFYLKYIPWSLLITEKATIFALFKEKPIHLQIIIYGLLTLASISSLNVVFLTGGRLFEYIFKDLKLMKKEFSPFSTKYFNIAILSQGFIGILILLTNTFSEILNTTSWFILIFTFLTSVGFLRYLLNGKIKISSRLTKYMLIISTLTFTIFSFIIGISGIYFNQELFFKGIMYLLIGFLLYHILFLINNRKEKNAKV